MDIFLTLLTKIVPLYLIIVLGFLAAKYLKAQKETLASILIYTITPVIVFHGVVTSPIGISILVLPLVYFVIGITLCLSFYKLGKIVFRDNTRNILAFTAGTGNIGYFGLPVAVAVFGERAVPIVALMILGGIFYEASLGFFITARGHHTVTESINKVLKLPALYAFLLGLVLNFLQIPLNQIYFDTVLLFRGAYTVLGMMIIGMALTEIRALNIDWKFLSLSFLAKFLLWPVLMILFIFLDRSFLHALSREIYPVMILLSISPLAANTVSYASLLKVQPQKAALAVLLSTLFALFYIPLIAGLFLINQP